LIHPESIFLFRREFLKGKLVVNAKMKATAEYRWTYLPIDFSDLRGSNGWNSVHPRAFRSDLFLRNITRELFYYKRWIIPTAADVVWSPYHFLQ
jgi:hypothetical protein